jgi:hypothetical protein
MEKSENGWQEAVSLFCQLLADAFRPPAKNVREARGQYIGALRCVAAFCTSMGGDKLISQQFHQLATALFDIQYGLEPKLLERGKRPGVDWLTRRTTGICGVTLP